MGFAELIETVDHSRRTKPLLDDDLVPAGV
jgi:hypothetical protein